MSDSRAPWAPCPRIAHSTSAWAGYANPALARAQQSAPSQADANDLSVRLELQADCFAGVWAHSIKDLGVFQPGEIREAIDAASTVGDDRIQERVQGQVNPETWTHGSSEQRVAWFTRGWERGDPAECNPFAG